MTHTLSIMLGVTVVEACCWPGNDTVKSSVSLYANMINVENLTLLALAASAELAILEPMPSMATVANNILTGAAATTDITGGGNGNDTYVINNSATLVIEVAAEGTDTVQSSASFALGANVDNLTLTGTAALVGTGNSDANVIVGNTGANTLIGGDGADTLTGGAGKDVFMLTSLSDSSTTANDIITDFASFAAIDATNDRINLSAIDASMWREQ